MTNRELLKMLRLPGEVCAMVLVPEDVKWMRLVKADVIHTLQALPKDDRALWRGERDFSAGVWIVWLW